MRQAVAPSRQQSVAEWNIGRSREFQPEPMVAPISAAGKPSRIANLLRFTEQGTYAPVPGHCPHEHCRDTREPHDHR